MSDLKTRRNEKSVDAFLDSVENPTRREDARRILELMEDVTGEPPAMWGDSIVGFGSYHYKYESGREGDWFLTGFSPRKSSLTLYIMSGFRRYEDLLGRLGKHKTGRSCLYVNRLEQVNLEVLRQLVEESVAAVKEREKVENG